MVFWSIHQPRRIGLTVAFLAGLCLDVQQASLLGQHALAYSALIYFAIMVHRRILWFSLIWQTLQLFPLFLAAHIIIVTLRLIGGAAFPGWTLFLAPVFEALLWPIATGVLLLPQRRAHDLDVTRPL
jgi:rod shape-determining protein MreD